MNYVLPRFAVCCLAIAVSACSGPNSDSVTMGDDDLATLFREWRAFEAPDFVDGVPDYSVAAMAAQQRELPTWKARLEAMEPGGGPVSE